MAVEVFFNSVFNIETFHRFNFFLGTHSGELLRRFIELIFFLIILYMIFSEYKRNRKRQYRYLIVGFLALSLRQAFMSLILFSLIFSDIPFQRFEVFIGMIDIYLQTVALILLIGAFLFPAFKKRTFLYQKRLIFSILIVSIVIFGAYSLFKLNILDENYTAILELVQIFVLISPFYIVKRGEYKKIKYGRSILLAFFIYLLIPLISFVSLMLYGDIDPRVVVLQRPLPFISVLLLMRTVYLTLVDKAFLKSKLKESEEMVKHEKELNKLKDFFISIVSHELRTPLTSMKLYLSLFKKNKFGKVNKKQEKALNILINENDRLGDLITNLLTINKMEADKIEINKEEFDLKNIIDDLYIKIAENKGIKVQNKVKSMKVKVDKQMMKQVYINLMNNAIKFSEKGNKVIINSGSKKKEWFLSVKDEGIGIPKKEIPKLFDKFYQVENTLVRKSQGVGLGLAIVKHIVDLHDGRIEVVSKVREGSEFRVWMKK